MFGSEIIEYIDEIYKRGLKPSFRTVAACYTD